MQFQDSMWGNGSINFFFFFSPMGKIKIIYKFQAELAQLEILRLQYCKTLFFSECNILFKMSVELECPPEALRSTAHHPVLTLRWYSLAPGTFVWCQGVLTLVRGHWCLTDIWGLFLCPGSHGCFLIWFKSLSTEQWGVLWDLARSMSGCCHTKWQVTGRNSRMCVCTVTGRMPKALQTQSKGQIFQTLTLHIIIYFKNTSFSKELVFPDQCSLKLSLTWNILYNITPLPRTWWHTMKEALIKISP